MKRLFGFMKLIKGKLLGHLFEPKTALSANKERDPRLENIK